MTQIIIVAPRKMWETIRSHIEPRLPKLDAKVIEAREPERRESAAPHILVTGLTPETEAILLDAVLGVEPIVNVKNGESEDSRNWS